jgi:hypothetical protein
MKSLKKFFVLILLASICGNAFTSPKLSIDIKEVTKLSETLMSTQSIEEEWYKTHIPEEYYNAFIYNTRNNPEVRLSFYSLMVHESGNFKGFVNKNKNGSYDYGPSQLNSYNINNPNFMKVFAPKDMTYINTKYCYYMVTSINYYIALTKEWGDYAFYAYNGGPRAAKLKKQNITSSKYRSLLKNVTSYYNCVTKNINKFQKELSEYVSQQRELHIEKIVAELELAFILLLNRDRSFNRLIEYTKQFVSYSTLYYIKREDFLELKTDEFFVIVDSIIGRFDKQIC